MLLLDVAGGVQGRTAVITCYQSGWCEEGSVSYNVSPEAGIEIRFETDKVAVAGAESSRS